MLLFLRLILFDKYVLGFFLLLRSCVTPLKIKSVKKKESALGLPSMNVKLFADIAKYNIAAAREYFFESVNPRTDSKINKMSSRAIGRL